MTELQLLPLIRLRWRMVRSRPGRRGFMLLAAALPGMCLVAVAIGSLAPPERSFDVTLVAPTVYLSAALLASVAPLVAGGGHELFPPEQLVAYPIRSRTQYYASLALTPLNLAWTAQLLGLLGLTAFITPRTPWLPLALLLCLAYISLITVAGHAVAWLVVGVRQHRAGRLISWGVAGAIVGSAAALTASERLSGLLDRSPTADLVAVVVASSDGPSHTYAVTLALIVLVTGVAAVAGQHACAWALRLPGDATTRIDSQMVRRRTASSSVRGQLLAIDRASVWRSPSLRRGLLVLGILPGLVAAIAGVGWSSLVLLPALVSAGAGLLFGVNVFCLDGTGSMWLASQPHRPEVQFWVKAQVIAEVSLVAIFITLLAGGLRTGRPPAVDEAVALVACTLVVTARVMAICLALSVSKPHRADLRGPRDAPAPPGIMAAYSVRLALSTTLIGLVFSGLAAAAAWQWSLAVAVPFLLLSARHVLQTRRMWRDPSVRGRVVSVVSAG